MGVAGFYSIAEPPVAYHYITPYQVGQLSSKHTAILFAATGIVLSI